MNVLELSEQEIGRRESLQQLRDMGINPYPAAEYPTNAFSTDIKNEFKDDEEPRQVCIAGRMMSRRVMGKASFVELQDSKGRIQVYVTRDDICPDENKDMYNVVFKKLLDIGDFIGIRGFVFRTQMGEISVHAQEITLLSKSLKPLPIVKYKDGVAYDKFDDPELRYRQRYVDLVVNEGVKETFEKRAIVTRTLLNILDRNGYPEVDTPVLQTIAGGASAEAEFLSDHDAVHLKLLPQDLFAEGFAVQLRKLGKGQRKDCIRAAGRQQTPLLFIVIDIPHRFPALMRHGIRCKCHNMAGAVCKRMGQHAPVSEMYAVKHAECGSDPDPGRILCLMQFLLHVCSSPYRFL